MSIGETRQSLEEMKKAIKLDPDWPTPYVDMAKTYMLLGKNIGAAKIWFQKAISIDEKNSEAYHYLGKIASLQCDFELCDKYFQKALSLSVTKAEIVEIFKDIERANAEEKIKQSNPNFD